MSAPTHEILEGIFEKYGMSVWDCELRTIAIELLATISFFEKGGPEECLLRGVDEVISDLKEYRSVFRK